MTKSRTTNALIAGIIFTILAMLTWQVGSALATNMEMNRCIAAGDSWVALNPADDAGNYDRDSLYETCIPSTTP